MKELEYLKIIHNTLSDSSFLGDDCALLKEFGLCVTQDTLVEDVHFVLSSTTPFELAQKAINVNLSDLAAALSEPLFVTISLSIPSSLNNTFVEEFYKGVESCCKQYGIKVIGGDLTSSDKIFISICAIGKKNLDIDVSRSFAEVGNVIVTTGVHGDSAAGLKFILDSQDSPDYFVKKHLCPLAQIKKSKQIAEALNKAGVKKIAMMDTSDGLGDAIYKISKASGCYLNIETIPVSDILKETFPQSWKNLAFWGGEDFELLFCVPEEVYNLLDKSQFYKIGTVINQSLSDDLVKDFEDKSFKHFI